MYLHRKLFFISIIAWSLLLLTLQHSVAAKFHVENLAAVVVSLAVMVAVGMTPAAGITGDVG